MNSAPPAVPDRAVRDRAGALLDAFARSGYAPVAPAILQPSEPYFDLSGEDMRRHMYLVTDTAGREFCLRPDLTIAVARQYLASGSAPLPANFCYLGPVFRDNGSGSGAGEFLQAGIESYGRGDTAAADAEALALGIAATTHWGLPAPRIVMGDVALFKALIAALDLPPAWKRRLVNDFNRKASFAQDRLTLAGQRRRSDYEGVLAALARSDPRGAHALVTDLLSIAGKSVVGGRSIAEIADRFLEQAELGASNTLPDDASRLIERFLAVAAPPARAAQALHALSAEAGVSLGAALDLFENRTALLRERGVDTERIEFATAFGRGVDYYTGFVFELHDPGGGTPGQLVAGGRYDGLLSRLGSPTPVAAVGLAVWIERLAACTRAAGTPR